MDDQDLKGVEKPEDLDNPHSAKTIRCAEFRVRPFSSDHLVFESTTFVH